MEYEQIWIDGLNRADISAADAVFATDCIVHITGIAAPLTGIDAFKGFISGMLQAFPDIHFTIEDQLAQGDRAAFRWSATGTHSGTLGEAPATGKKITVEGLIIDRVVAGKVQERWEQWDQSLMLQQLGFA